MIFLALLSAFVLLEVCLPSHTSKLLFHNTQHNLSGYLCSSMLFACNSMLIHFMFRFHKDLFIFKPKLDGDGNFVAQHNKKISSDSCVDRMNERTSLKY